MKHFARTVDFTTLAQHLQEETEKGTVTETLAKAPLPTETRRVAVTIFLS
jgi:hypothetical protein